MCPNLERIASGTIKRDFLNRLLDDFKSDNTYITFRAGRIFYVISNLSQKGLVHLKYNLTFEPAIGFLSPIDQTG